MKPVQKKRPALFQKESPISVKLGKNAFLFFEVFSTNPRQIRAPTTFYLRTKVRAIGIVEYLFIKKKQLFLLFQNRIEQ